MNLKENTKLMMLVERLFNGYDPVTAIIESEVARGFKVVRPGDTAWFRATDWRPSSIASIDRKQVRLVLLHAFVSGRGAMTRTFAAIRSAGLKPMVIDPTRELGATLARRGFSPKQAGTTFEDRETIWSAKC